MHAEQQMISLCFETCARCDKTFRSGERMIAVAYEDGEPYGWCCDDCVEALKREAA